MAARAERIKPMLQTIVEACFTSFSHARNGARRQTMPAAVFATPKSQIGTRSPQANVRSCFRTVDLDRGLHEHANPAAGVVGAFLWRTAMSGTRGMLHLERRSPIAGHSPAQGLPRPGRSQRTQPSM